MLGSASAVAILVAATAGAPDVAAGKRLYRDGIGTDGKPVAAVVQGDVRVTGAHVSCASCHGRSGMGAVEGRTLASPVGATFLAAPQRRSAAGLH